MTIGLRHFDLRTFRSDIFSTLRHISQSHFDLWTFRTHVISNFDFRFLCHFDLMTFQSNVISTLGHFTKRQVNFLKFVLIRFPFDVISIHVLFGFMSFRPSDFSILCYLTYGKFIWGDYTFEHFVPMSSRTFDFSNQCISTLRSLGIEQKVISTFALWTFCTDDISKFGLFGSFRPLNFSILCYFDLKTLPKVISTFGHFVRTFRSNVFSSLRYFTKRHFDFWTFRFNVISSDETLTPPDTWSCPIWDLHLF